MRYENSRLQEASSLPDVRILDRAVPPVRPTKNKKVIIIALGTLLGLAAGVGMAFVLDLTDKRFRYVDQVSSGLGLTILGVIPEIRRAKGRSASPEEAAQVIESFRTVRLNLLHMVPDATSIALTITSPMPGDGKSLISSNLAFSFAEAGYRTLLIDGDTRRGELHRTLGLERIPGLLDHLADGAPLDGILRQTSHPHLTLMPSGSRHRNAPELMGSDRMRKLIAAMRARYDVIIVDSPPLGAGIDPFVLGTVTGQLMLVVRAGETDRMLAEAKLQVVDQLPIRLVGAVLNDVRTSLDEYKYYSYSEGYGAVDEIELTGGGKLLAKTEKSRWVARCEPRIDDQWMMDDGYEHSEGRLPDGTPAFVVTHHPSSIIHHPSSIFTPRLPPLRQPAGFPDPGQGGPDRRARRWRSARSFLPPIARHRPPLATVRRVALHQHGPTRLRGLQRCWYRGAPLRRRRGPETGSADRRGPETG